MSTFGLPPVRPSIPNPPPCKLWALCWCLSRDDSSKPLLQIEQVLKTRFLSGMLISIQTHRLTHSPASRGSGIHQFVRKSPWGFPGDPLMHRIAAYFQPATNIILIPPNSQQSAIPLLTAALGFTVRSSNEPPLALIRQGSKDLITARNSSPTSGW